MTFPVFPNVTSRGAMPSFPYSEDHTPRVLSAKFGDGYSQEVIDGINTDEFSTQVVWNNMFSTEKNTIVNFLAGLGGIGRFTFTTPFGLAQTFSCPKWKIEETQGNVWNVSATFIRRFDVG